MDSIIKEFVKNGRDVNELMNMPYTFVLKILKEEEKPKVSSSFFDLL